VSSTPRRDRAKVRVLIESLDGKNSWTTTGVSTNLIEASWLALVDAIEYKLFKDSVKLLPRGDRAHVRQR